jgi:hypothetical protein
MFTKKKNQTPLEVVQEIHQRTLTSGDACLAEANKILLSANGENLELFEQMKKQGFGNVKEIKEKESEIKLQAEAREKARLISDYKVRYPNKKFISTEEMDKICTDYKLLLGADQHYTGSMPARSMKEIIAFKLHPTDEIHYKGTWRATESLQHDKTKGVIEWKEIPKDQYMRESENGTKLVQNNKRTHYISNTDYKMVAAPESMFNIEGLVREGNQLKKVVEVDDPVCLQPVRFGYIIVAVWGEEIAIAKMQNEGMN